MQCPRCQPRLAARDRGLRTKPRLCWGPGGGSRVQSGGSHRRAHTCATGPWPAVGSAPRPGSVTADPTAIRSTGRWPLVPTALGFCLKVCPQRPVPTPVPPAPPPPRTSTAFCTFSLQQRVCLSRSVRGRAVSRWPAWPARPSPPGSLVPYLFNGSAAPTCKAAAGRGDNAP